MVKLSNVDRARILGMLEGGRSRRDVAAQFNVCQATLSNLIRRYNETHEVKDRHRSGRPRATTPQEDRRIRLLSLRSRTTPATTIRATIRNERRVQQGLSVQTVRNRLHESGLRSRKACVKPALTERHRQVRLAWARQHGSSGHTSCLVMSPGSVWKATTDEYGCGAVAGNVFPMPVCRLQDREEAGV